MLKWLKASKRRLDEKGREIPDPTPVAIPVGFHRPLSLQERLARAVREEISQLAMKNGQETFEEAEDFDVGDDFDPSSPYELEFDPTLNREVPRQEKEFLDKHRREFDEFVKLQKAKPKKKEFEEEVPVKRKKKQVVIEDDDE